MCSVEKRHVAKRVRLPATATAWLFVLVFAGNRLLPNTAAATAEAHFDEHPSDVRIASTSSEEIAATACVAAKNTAVALRLTDARGGPTTG